MSLIIIYLIMAKITISKVHRVKRPKVSILRREWNRAQNQTIIFIYSYVWACLLSLNLDDLVMIYFAWICQNSFPLHFFIKLISMDCNECRIFYRLSCFCPFFFLFLCISFHFFVDFCLECYLVVESIYKYE